jgi:hypothetical protein
LAGSTIGWSERAAHAAGSSASREERKQLSGRVTPCGVAAAAARTTRVARSMRVLAHSSSACRVSGARVVSGAMPNEGGGAKQQRPV